MNTKEKILQSAQDLFVKNGIHKTSTAQICKKAGIASGTLFVHFKTKQILVDCMYGQKKERAAVVFDTVLQDQGDVEEDIFCVSKVVIDYYLENPEDFLFFRRVENEPELSETVQKIHEMEKSHFELLIRRWCASGVLKKLPPRMIYSVWSGLIYSFTQTLIDQDIVEVSMDDLDVMWDALSV